jgi:hypothetical protein
MVDAKAAAPGAESVAGGGRSTRSLSTIVGARGGADSAAGGSDPSQPSLMDKRMD